MRSDKRRVAKQAKVEMDFYSVAVQWSRTVLNIAIIAFVISLGYILYGVFSGALNQLDVDQARRLTGNLNLMGQLLTAAAFLASASLVIMTLEEVAYSVLIGMVGAGMVFGMPILVASNLQSAAVGPATAITVWTKNAGMGVLFVVGLRLALEIANQIRSVAIRAIAQQAEADTTVTKKKKYKKPGLWDHCWDMPYCHDAVRDVCPAYKARRSCWRYGYGCNCDPSLIETLIRTGGASKGKSAVKATSTQKLQDGAYVRSDLQADGKAGTSERTIPCRKCPIFIEHQRQKFRIVNPAAIILTLVGFAVAYQPLLKLYELLINGMAQIAARMTYGTAMVDAGEWVQYLNTPAVQVFFFIILGLFVLSYVLKFVEWLVLRQMVL